MVGVPANANSNQRFLTLEAMRSAGFEVLGMVNEPAAATAPMSPSDQLGAAPVVADAALDDADSLLALSNARTW